MRISPLFFASLYVIGCVSVATAQERQFDFQDTTLENGLRVITLEDFSCPIVTVQVWYGVGSKDENPNRQGFAHMFEHMMFRGTGELASDAYFDLINTVGGSLNGTTNFDRTNYYETVPSDQIDLAMWLEAERMLFLNITQEGFDTERAVVEEERRMTLNTPYGTLLEHLLPTLFKTHPYRWSAIGKIAHLRAAKLDELEHFWDTYYVPSNATLLIVGDISHRDAMKKVDKYFGWMPKLPTPPRVTAREAEQTERREIAMRERLGPVPAAVSAFRAVPTDHPDTVPLQLAFDILAVGESSRMHVDLVREKKLGVQMIPIMLPLQQDSLYIVGIAMMPFGKADHAPVFEAIQAHLDHVAADGVTDRELQKAKNAMARTLVTSQLTIQNKAMAIGNAVVNYGTPEALNGLLDQVAAVTNDDIKRVASTYLIPQRRTDLSVIPDKEYVFDPDAGWTPEDYTPPAREYSKRGLERPQGWAAEPPLAQVHGAVPEIPFEEKTLKNGLRVVVVSNDEVPFTTAVLGMKYGAWTDDEKAPGVASMTLGMLTKGTENYSATEMAEALEFEALTLTGSVDRDVSSVETTALADKLPRALELMSEVVRSPEFPEEEIKTYKRILKSELAVQSKDPKYLATRELRRRIYGKHPYAKTPSGELEDLESIGRDQLVEWWSNFVRPEACILYIAGDVTAKEAFDLAKEHFGAWNATSKKAPKVKTAKPPAREATQIFIIHEPNAVQSEIRIGQLGFDARYPDALPARVVEQVFGGSFGSRLNSVIRVERGLTYGARGGWNAGNLAGDFTASTFTKTESTAETVQAVLDVIGSMQTDAPSSEEMFSAKSYLIGRMAGRFETPQSMVRHLWNLEFNQLPDDRLARILESVRATDSEEVRRIARDHIDMDKLTIVVLGDADKIRSSLERIASVTIVE